jgi:hypothetical protein
MLALHSGSKIDGPAFAQREVIFERQNNTKGYAKEISGQLVNNH